MASIANCNSHYQRVVVVTTHEESSVFTIHIQFQLNMGCQKNTPSVPRKKYTEYHEITMKSPWNPMKSPFNHFKSDLVTWDLEYIVESYFIHPTTMSYKKIPWDPMWLMRWIPRHHGSSWITMESQWNEQLNPMEIRANWVGKPHLLAIPRVFFQAGRWFQFHYGLWYANTYHRFA
jgi:hypothetical protein